MKEPDHRRFDDHTGLGFDRPPVFEMHCVFLVVGVLVNFGEDFGPEPERDITLTGVWIERFAGYVIASVLGNGKITVP